jgi:hypothetical protein
MHSFHVNSFGAAVLLSALLMGVLGAFVVVPVALIQWTWNSLAPQCFALPSINAWQAILLYIAGGCLLYLSGLVRVEFKSETLESKSETVENKSETVER